MTIVQVSGEGSITSGTTGTVTLNGTVAGNMLVLLFINTSNGTTGFPTSVSDTVNTYNQDVGIQSSVVTGSVAIYSANNIAGGNVTVTITVTSATCKFRLYEVSGLPTSGNLCGRDQKLEPATVTSHQMAGMTGINSVTDCAIFCVAAGSANAGGYSAGAGFTVDSSASTGVLYERGVFTGAQTGNLGTATSVNSMKTLGVMVAYQKAVSGGAGGMTSATQIYGLESVETDT